jgi:hypothetical protein
MITIYTSRRVINAPEDYVFIPAEGEIVFTDKAAWLAAQPPPKEPEALQQWLYSDPDYLALMDAYPGRIASFERAIANNRLDAAQVLWDGFTVPPELITKLSQRLPEFGYQDLLDRLYPSPI